MEVPELLVHGEVLEGLWRAARDGRLPHALLFEGVPGTGRFLAALHLAQGLFCAQGPGRACRACPPCKRFLSGREGESNHPDLYVVDPVREGSDAIALGRIAVRDGNADCAEGFLRLCAAEGGWRVVLIREAERLAPAAQNALLKTLEEPAADTLLVLETGLPDRLLETIRSRCVRVAFEPLDAASTARVLEGAGLEPEGARRLARWSGGSPGVALRLHREGATEARRLLEGLVCAREAPLEAARALWELGGDFGEGTPRAKARRRAAAWIDLSLAVLRDEWHAAAGKPAERLRHGDLFAAGEAPAEPQLEEAVEALCQLRSDLAANLAPEGVVDRSALVLHGLRRAAPRR